MSEDRRDLQRWADSAQYHSEPLKAAGGPRVHLLWMTADPLGAIAAACKMYKGEVVRDLATITDGERVDYLEQIKKTKLKAPFEFVKFHFMIEGVPRSITHQMVRQRTAVYAQESLRFAVVDGEHLNGRVALPPSLEGSNPHKPERDKSEADRNRYKWDTAVASVGRIYQDLVDNGMPAEEARDLLPHGITTRLHYSTDLRALLDHAGNRLCTQAQLPWRAMFGRIAEAIRNMDTHEDPLSWGEYHEAHEYGTIGNPSVCNGMDSAYMARFLAPLFRPVCFQTGRCEFNANFDRHCAIRERVDQFEEAGIPPSRWEEGAKPVEARNSEGIPGIAPYEWLADGAARS